jgi:type II secretory pathway pseudopilin PulG
VRHLLRALLVALAVLSCASAATSPALASCVQTSVAERASLAEVVVYGTVTETRQTFAAASGVIRFRPERFPKGTLAGEVEVYLGPTKGGAITSVDYEAARRGEAHTLYLRSAGNASWQTDACSGSHVGAPTAEETSFFGAGSAAPPSAPKDNTPLAVVAVAIAMLALAGALFARR